MDTPETSHVRTQARVTVSARLSDGTLVEMLHAPDARTTALACGLAGRVLTEAPTDLVPYSPENNLLVHGVVLFPSAVAEYTSDADLLADVRSFIHRYVDLPGDFEELAAHYVLYTWVHDVFQEAPYLRVRGDYGSGKSRFLLTVGSLCYKPIFASGASTTSPIFRILDAFRGTLVVDESDFRLTDEKADIIKILNQGNVAGFPVLRADATPQKEFNPRAFNVFGPKLIASRRLFEDRALESRCISHEMGVARPRADIPLNLSASFHAEARALRNQLLCYRFRNWDKDRDLVALIDPQLEPRIAQILAPLLATVEDPAVRGRLKNYGARLGRHLAVERAFSLEAQLVAIIVECLDDTDQRPTVKILADRFAAKHAAELQYPVTPRWIGGVLRDRLGLELVRTKAGYTLAPVTRERLQRLAEKYGVLSEAHDLTVPGDNPHVATDDSMSAEDMAA